MPAAARTDSLFTNPIAAGFLAVELRQRHEQVRGESDGNPLVAPRLALLAQAAMELEQTAAAAAGS